MRSIQRSKEIKIKKQVKIATMAVLVYLIWQKRNCKIWRQKEVNEESLLCNVRNCVRNRLIFAMEIDVQRDEWIVGLLLNV